MNEIILDNQSASRYSQIKNNITYAELLNIVSVRAILEHPDMSINKIKKGLAANNDFESLFSSFMTMVLIGVSEV